MIKKAVKVLIVDDSIIFRETLSRSISKDHTGAVEKQVGLNEIPRLISSILNKR